MATKSEHPTVEQVQPHVRCAADLAPSLWFSASEPGTRTRKAAQATVAVRVFHTCPWKSDRTKAMGFTLLAYRDAIKHPVNVGFDVLLRSLLTDLRHLAQAYGIQLESTPRPNTSSLAGDLVAVYDEIRNAARGLWAPALAATGSTAEDVEHAAFTDFHRDCTTR